ncbi:hypothetical protein [Streptomyces vietnamensis]
MTGSAMSGTGRPYDDGTVQSFADRVPGLPVALFNGWWSVPLG